jgi:hypothetical protein
MRNKLLGIIGVILGLTIVGGIANNAAPQPQVESITTHAVTPTPSPIPVLSPVPSATPSASASVQVGGGLSDDNYYENVNGETIHSPVYSDQVPSGATAICGDETYSFSQSRRGTCSHHGGVTQWL